MKPAPGTYVYQTEFGTGPDGERYQRVWRRRVLSVSDDRIALSGAELLTIPLDAPGDYVWEPCGGMLAMDLGMSRERFHERGYTTRFSMGRGAA